MESKREIKYHRPTKLDKRPYGTIFLTLAGEEGIEELYIQTSQEIEEPAWQKMDIFLENVFKEFFSDEKFIEECLRLYADKNKKSLRNINKIVKDGEKKDA